MSPLVPCPLCKRPTAPDLLRDVRGIPAALRGPCEMVCDQCAALWHYTGALRYCEQARLRGMPAAVVAKVAAKHGEPTPPARSALVAKLTARLTGRALPGVERAVRRQAREAEAVARRAERAARDARPTHERAGNARRPPKEPA